MRPRNTTDSGSAGSDAKIAQRSSFHHPLTAATAEQPSRNARKAAPKAAPPTRSAAAPQRLLDGCIDRQLCSRRLFLKLQAPLLDQEPAQQASSHATNRGGKKYSSYRDCWQIPDHQLLRRPPVQVNAIRYIRQLAEARQGGDARKPEQKQQVPAKRRERELGQNRAEHRGDQRQCDWKGEIGVQRNA